MDDTLSIILKDTYSLTQLRLRLRVLKTHLIASFFGASTPLLDSSTSGEDIPPQELNWLNSLPASLYKKFNKENVYEMFSSFDSQMAKLPILTMYLTFEPDDATLNQISAFARKTFGVPLLLLDIKLDPHLIAGASLSWKGILRDYSLRAKLTEKKEEILQGFKKFLR